MKEFACHIVVRLDRIFGPIGIGSYYIVYYLILTVILVSMTAAAFFYRNNLKVKTSDFLTTVTLFLFLRIVLLDNPLAFGLYTNLLPSEAIGYRQHDAIYMEMQKYKRSFVPEALDFLAIGSSQVGAIFHHWEGLPGRIKVFSLAGMKPIDYVLYRSQIKALRPACIVLHLSEFDIANFPQLQETINVGPNQGVYLFDLFKKIRQYPVGKNYYKMFFPVIAGELLPEYKYSFVFRGLLNRVIGPGHAEAGGPPQTGSVPSAELMNQIAKCVRYLDEKAIDFNMSFLEDFLMFCEKEGFEVVIVEGQYNPLGYNEKTGRLNGLVKELMQQLPLKYKNVRFIPRAELYNFAIKDYRDVSHVVPEAARAYTGRLSALLERVP